MFVRADITLGSQIHKAKMMYPIVAVVLFLNLAYHVTQCAPIDDTLEVHDVMVHFPQIFTLLSNNREKRSAPGNMQMVDHMFATADMDNNDQLDIDEFWKTFHQFDVDHVDGISKSEYLGTMARTLRRINGNWSPAHMDKLASRLFSAGDFDKNGRLTQDDAMAMLYNLDENHDGHISKCEYRKRWMQVFQRIGLIPRGARPQMRCVD